MTDSKSKFPDMKELGAIASKLFKDIKNSVTDILEDYKKKRDDASKPAPAKRAPAAHKETPKKEPAAKKESAAKKDTSAAPKKTAAPKKKAAPAAKKPKKD